MILRISTVNLKRIGRKTKIHALGHPREKMWAVCGFHTYGSHIRRMLVSTVVSEITCTRCMHTLGIPQPEPEPIDTEKYYVYDPK